MTTGNDDGRAIDRRGFVKLAGAGAGLALAGQLAVPGRARGAGNAAPSTPIKLKVGVLVPTGSSYSNMGQSLLDGLNLGFKGARSGHSPVHASLSPTDVLGGYGGADTATQQLLGAGSDVVVAGVSALVAATLGDIVSEAQKPFVVANVGAHVVTPADRNAYILHNSLLYWQASFAAGKWAAVHVGKQAFLASALTDSGYDAVYAFRAGFEALGGTVVGTAVTHVDPADNGLTDAFAAISNSGAHVVYGLYSGPQAAQFVQGYAASGVKATLLTGNFAVDEFQLPSIGSSAIGVRSVASWTRAHVSKANEAFSTSFRSAFRRPPDPFAALGYDTALIVAEGARRSALHGVGTSQMIPILASVPILGPRGLLFIDGLSNTVVGPLRVRQVERTSTGLTNVDRGLAPAVGSFPAPLSSLASGTVGGYINEYLCCGT